MATGSPKCDFCEKGHLNYTCPEFKALPVAQRLTKVKERRLCFNCLRSGHRSGKGCQSDRTCSKCKRRHHTLLHAEDSSRSEDEATTKSELPETSKDLDQVTSAACSSKQPTTQVLLLTAVVNVLDRNNEPHPCRFYWTADPRQI